MSSELAKKLIIAIGDYGVGKTAFAKWYAKNNSGLFIDFGRRQITNWSLRCQKG